MQEPEKSNSEKIFLFVVAVVWIVLLTLGWFIALANTFGNGVPIKSLYFYFLLNLTFTTFITIVAIVRK